MGINTVGKASQQSAYPEGSRDGIQRKKKERDQPDTRQLFLNVYIRKKANG
jgi:hypothetical protein